ncbi:hypothetical protein Pla110_02620 [Polystyrenella longa]|uniref:YscD cytoplasmic domain-containing protein n=1 Tax=Polystyrenella longa TaxID=2528007 RepID=A0A518CH61_9PLAN|nr:hypothetical protein [Polystyrenella longa]QDU78558.1 hypothetical protein Pla110_02620 [Polystyrenella longa]
MDDLTSNQQAPYSPGTHLHLRVFSYARELSASLKPGSPVKIGSDPSCEIQIAELPLLHCTISWDGENRPRLTPTVAIPLVLVNGQLNDGKTGEPIDFSDKDTLHIGLRTIVRAISSSAAMAEPATTSQPATISMATNAAPTSAVPMPAAPVVASTEAPVASICSNPENSTSPNPGRPTPVRERENLMQKPLNELTAAELIELLEQEEQQVEEFDTQHKSGLQNLLKAVKKVSEEEARKISPATIPLHQVEPVAATKSPAIEQELHYLVEELSELVEDLCDQVQSFAKSEAPSPKGAETTFKKLLREQHDILEKLDTIGELIGGDSGPAPIIRKIA